MRLKAFIAAVFCAAITAGAGAAGAFAGEITGPSLPGGVPEDQSNPTPALSVAQSICAASGLNHLHPGEDPSRTQSWGQLVRIGLKDVLTDLGLAPGESCNGHTGIFATGGGGA